MIGLLAAVALVVDVPTASAANATNIDVQLPAGASISGTIRDPNGVPVRDAQVVALGALPEHYDVSDVDGRYRINGLKSTGYTVQVRSFGNLAGGFFTTANPAHYASAAASATKVMVGPSKTGIDVRLPAGFAISGHVTTLADVGILIPGTNAQALTDKTGYYRLGGLSPGAYKIQIAAGYGKYVRGWYANNQTNYFAPVERLATPVVVGPSKGAIDFAVPIGHTITGTVTTSSGEGMFTSAVIEAISKEGSFRGEGSDETGADPWSEYKVQGLPAGSYKLHVMGGFAEGDGYYTTLEADHFTTSVDRASTITLGSSKSSVNMTVTKGFSITGRVFDTSGTPLRYMNVVASNPGNGRDDHTDISGRYTLSNLSSGDHILYVEDAGTGFAGDQRLQHGWYTTANPDHFTAVKTSARSVTLGPSKTGVNIKVPVGYTISGKVRWPGGGPPTCSCAVVVWAKSATDERGASLASDGSYAISGLSKGAYTLRYEPPDTGVPGASEWFAAYVRGYYTTANPSHFTTNLSEATKVTVGP
jgi:hypothetical protein